MFIYIYSALQDRMLLENRSHSDTSDKNRTRVDSFFIRVQRSNYIRQDSEFRCLIPFFTAEKIKRCSSIELEILREISI